MIKNEPSQRLIKHIIRSYARLADKTVVRPILKENIPPILSDKTFYNKLDESSKKWLSTLMKSLSVKHPITNPNPPASKAPLKQSSTMPNVNLNLVSPLVMNQQQMNQMSGQLGYIMQQPNEYNYGNMYGENYMRNPINKTMFMAHGGMPSNGYGNINQFYNYKNN